MVWAVALTLISSFMLYASYFVLKVREVSNINHTAAEYFDPYSNEWKQIDTSYKIQISNDDGQILSAFKIYKKDVGELLHVINTFPIFKEKKELLIIEQLIKVKFVTFFITI